MSNELKQLECYGSVEHYNPADVVCKGCTVAESCQSYTIAGMSPQRRQAVFIAPLVADYIKFCAMTYPELIGEITRRIDKASA